MFPKGRDGGARVEHLLEPAGRKYMNRHNGVTKCLHWRLHGKYRFKEIIQYYDHQMESALENEEGRILLSIVTDRTVQSNRLDTAVVEKKTNKSMLIDLARPIDGNIKRNKKRRWQKMKNSAMRWDSYRKLEQR